IRHRCSPCSSSGGSGSISFWVFACSQSADVQRTLASLDPGYVESISWALFVPKRGPTRGPRPAGQPLILGSVWGADRPRLSKPLFWRLSKAIVTKSQIDQWNSHRLLPKIPPGASDRKCKGRYVVGTMKINGLTSLALFGRKLRELLDRHPPHFHPHVANARPGVLCENSER